MNTIINKLAAAALLVVVGISLVVGYRLVKSEIAAEHYKTQYTELSGEYEGLRELYNQAVSKTAVTELLVKDGGVCVVIRTADGSQKQIDTPYSADTQLYVEYLVLDGRLWIRRVFNDRTAPEDGVLINPELASVDWNSPQVKVGKAISRKLTEGRWVITVTGDGSLGLAKSDRRHQLEQLPEVREFEPRQGKADAEPKDIGAGDVLRHVISGG